MEKRLPPLTRLDQKQTKRGTAVKGPSSLRLLWGGSNFFTGPRELSSKDPEHRGKKGGGGKVRPGQRLRIAAGGHVISSAHDRGKEGRGPHRAEWPRVLDTQKRKIHQATSQNLVSTVLSGETVLLREFAQTK